MVMVRTTLGPVPTELLALTVTEYVPVVVGTPVIAPFAVLAERPGGKPEMLKLVAELLAKTV